VCEAAVESRAVLPKRRQLCHASLLMERSDRSYWDAWRLRERQAAATAAAWRKARLAEAQSAADALVEQLGARRVVLFGSLASERAKPGSDVDIWVDGLPPEQYLEAIALARAHIHQAEVDLVPSEWASPSLRARVEAEGVLLGGA